MALLYRLRHICGGCYITALRIEISCLEHENQRLKDEVSQLEEQADDLIDERDRLQRTVVHFQG
jgi:FtsZ-binding cell division protein ZapB